MCTLARTRDSYPIDVSHLGFKFLSAVTLVSVSVVAILILCLLQEGGEAPAEEQL